MPLVKMNYSIAMAAARDAGDRHRRARGGKKWDATDYVVCMKEFNRLYPEFYQSGPRKTGGNDGE